MDDRDLLTKAGVSVELEGGGDDLFDAVRILHKGEEVASFTVLGEPEDEKAWAESLARRLIEAGYQLGRSERDV